MKAEGGEIIVFAPLGFWRAFLFCVRLRAHGIPYRLCKNPRSVVVRARNLDQAGALYEGLKIDQGSRLGGQKSDQGAE